MDDLLKLIETLRERIDSHEAVLGTNEALTRSVLIDPLLRALGWDTEDPAQVIPEFHISDGDERADYALFTDGDPPKVAIIVEAKPLGTRLAELAVKTGKYCYVCGYGHFAITDGRYWTLYETNRDGQLEDKKIARFDLRLDPPVEMCSKALSLWRRRFVEGVSSLVEPAPMPKAGPSVPDTRQPSVESTSPHDLSGDWIPLSGLAPRGGEKPQELRLPSSDILGVTSWPQLVEKLTNWLVDQGYLSEAGLPIVTTGGTRFIVAGEPKQRDGSPFRSYKRAGRFFVNTDYGPRNHVRNLQTIIKSTGQQASEFAVRTQKSSQGRQA